MKRVLSAQISAQLSSRWGVFFSTAVAVLATTSLSFVATDARAESARSGASVEAATVYSAIEKAHADASKKEPLGGSFAAGEKLLRAADPIVEANIVFNAKGPRTIIVCGFACTAPGKDVRKIDGAGGPTIPATTDALSESNKGYNEAAREFATRFNEQMGARAYPKAKGPETIAKALSPAELTINGVTIGQSNLYNAIGRFGTNAFHKEGDGGETLWIVCWTGADGTTLAFESGEAGGRDQTILVGRVLAKDTVYAHAKYCKESKKVSAALSLAGAKLGEAADDVEKARGAPSRREDQRMIWHYSVDQKKKSILSDVNIVSKDDRVTEISVSKETSH